MWMLRARQRHHRKAVGKRRQLLLQLMRWPTGKNEMNFVEIEAPVRGPRNGQMPGMDRIKRAAE